ncbi:MAG: hypothetical protein ABS63_03170 [Microbacterium sp. SCN 70-27]|nr:MAG: hypothetical protein ABS63_03170 [Microbacterium sp. SCN 70-27]
MVESMQLRHLSPAPGEPLVTEWEGVEVSGLLEWAGVPAPSGAGPVVVAIDGRSGGGKSTLAGRLVAAHRGAVLVGVDDIAWNAPMFGWAGLVRDGLLTPLAAGHDVRYRPPAWDEHGRAGAIEVAAHVPLVVLEGVGAACADLADLIDGVLWVQSDVAEAERRGLARDIAQGVNGDEAASIAFWHAWMADELAFQSAQRTWERADAIVAGTRVGDAPTGPLYAARRSPRVR